jgi:hypothetical protein
MQFSDTSGKQGLIQECEFWTNLGDAIISGDTTLLKVFANRINRAYDKVLPLVLSRTDKIKWDDINHTDHPIGTFDITSGISDYQLLVDDNSLSILNITDVMILQSSTSTEYTTLRRMTLDEPRALRAMSPNPTDSGVPSAFVEKNNTVFFDVKPNYTATAGGKFFFERIPDYFTSADTTQTPGIPAQFHALLALHASKDWLAVNKPESRLLVGEIKEEIAKQERNLKSANDQRNPTRHRVVGAQRLAI